MPQHTNNLTQFWQELKRRKVFRVIAMYAATAFIIMEAGDIMLPRLGLPDWTVTFIIVLLIIGFPISIILSWIFDITPEGVIKTESTKTLKQKETTPEPQKRKLGLSDLIIVVLIVVVGILAYPKIFKKDKFENIRDADGRISIAVMPFQNLTNDTLWDVWQEGIQNELITNLSNSKELSVRSYQTMFDILQSKKLINYASMTPSQASDITRKLEANSFILGSIKESGETIRINAQLFDSKTKEIYKTYQIDGNKEDDIFEILDSLSLLVKNYLEIKVLKQDADYEIIKYATTNSPEAYRYFIQGTNLFYREDYYSSVELFNKAIKVDPIFMSPRIFIIAAYAANGNYEEAKMCLEEAYKQSINISNISYTNQLRLKFWESHFDKDPQACIKYLELALEDDPRQRGVWYQKGLEYSEIYQYEKATECFEKAIDLDKQWGVGWKWVPIYTFTGFAYHKLGNHNREKEIYELGLSVLPDHPSIIENQTMCALSQDDSAVGNKYLNKFRSRSEEEGWEEYWILLSLGWIYEDAGLFYEAEKYLKQVIENNPKYQPGWTYLAKLYLKNDINIDEGMELLKHAYEIAPNSVTTMYLEGMGLFKQGDLKKALELLNKSWDLRTLYYHEHYLLIQEVEQALANQNQ